MAALTGCLISGGCLMAGSVGFTVPGTANPFLAGMPAGTTCCGGDSAPVNSPVLIPGLTLNGGDVLTFTNVTGSISNTPSASGSTPDGLSFFSSGPTNGIGGYVAPIDALVGVFLDNTLPTSSPTPATLDYTTIGTSFTTFSPQLKQVFFIGDGLTGTGSGSVQTFVVPNGATQLFLGDVDGFGWYNNSGAVAGTVNSSASAGTPEPATWALAVCAVSLFGLLRCVSSRSPEESGQLSGCPRNSC